MAASDSRRGAPTRRPRSSMVMARRRRPVAQFVGDDARADLDVPHLRRRRGGRQAEKRKLLGQGRNAQGLPSGSWPPGGRTPRSGVVGTEPLMRRRRRGRRCRRLRRQLGDGRRDRLFDDLERLLDQAPVASAGRRGRPAWTQLARAANDSEQTGAARPSRRASMTTADRQQPRRLLAQPGSRRRPESGAASPRAAGAGAGRRLRAPRRGGRYPAPARSRRRGRAARAPSRQRAPGSGASQSSRSASCGGDVFMRDTDGD